MDRWDLKFISEIMAECGDIALKYYEKPSWRFKKDRSLVTKADTEIEALLSSCLGEKGNPAYIIGEETVATKDEKYVQAALKGNAWVIDPIDGTAPYAHHVPTWGISIGFMQGGKLKEGAVLLPATGEFLATDGNVVMIANSCRGKRGIRICEFRRFNAIKHPLNEKGLVSLSQNLARTGSIRLVNPVQAVCCSVFSGAYLCLGRYMAYAGYLKLWDLAGILPILHRCGFKARLFNGEKLTLDVDDRCYILDRKDFACWKLKTQAVFAPSEKIAAFITSRIRDTGEMAQD